MIRKDPHACAPAKASLQSPENPENPEAPQSPQSPALPFRNLFPSTELCVDLKLLMLRPGRMPEGERMHGMLTRDAEDHFTFLQANPRRLPPLPQRNPHVYEGRCININRKRDGTLYPTFCRPAYTPQFTFRDFCREAAWELLAVTGSCTEHTLQEFTARMSPRPDSTLPPTSISNL